MKIVLAIAGDGGRFVAAGYPQPKPLIDVLGEPMVLWAVRSLLAVARRDMIFVVSSRHVAEFGLDRIVRDLFGPDIIIVQQEGPAEGQAASVLLAQRWIDNDDSLIIYNCDTYAPGVGARLADATLMLPAVDGFIPVFQSQAPNLSYVRANERNFVVEVAEKRVISRDATIGLYHFKRGSDFVWAAARMIADGMRVNNEYYVLPVYEYLIQERGRTFCKLDVDHVHVLGTPEELEAFKCWRLRR